MNTIIGIYFVFFLMDSVIAKSADAEAIIYRHRPKDKSQETEQADSDNVRYQHLSIDDSQGTVVDKIIGLEEEESEDSDVENLRNEIQRLNREHQKDRAKIQELETKLEQYHDEIVVKVAEILQARQRILENYDKISALDETTEDNKLAVESLQWTQKENNREIRRYREYKEKAAKRFHQIENKIERLETQKGKNEIAFQNIKDQLITHTKDQIYLRDMTKKIQNTLVNLTSNVSHLTSDLRNISENVQNDSNKLSECCFGKHRQKMNNPFEHNTNNGQERGDWSNAIKSDNMQRKGSDAIDIVEFGSGDLIDEYLSRFEESSNKVGENWPTKTGNNGEEILEYQSSGELGSGDIDELPHFEKGNFVEKQIFLQEIWTRDQRILYLNEKLSNLSDNMETIENKITSIQLGHFMHNLQESLINFTQNVITLDQWKISSNQIVNSTLQNQDQIIDLTNRIIGNNDKITDINWRLSNNELLSDRQYNILRMYVIRLNNTVEDIKEQLKEFHTKMIPKYHRKYNSESNAQGMETLISRVEDLALQVVYNQNRLGTLEVQVLNETLYQCRKFNMDTFQDQQLANHEAILKSNGNSIVLVHELVKQIDDNLHALDRDVKTNMRRIRGLASSLGSYKGIVPVVVNMQKEIDNFRFQLPKDCHDYYKQGFRKSDVYVIHPVGAKRSLKVTCHMSSEGGWTVLQQRFDGSIDFRQNWTAYRDGFGEPGGEYWIGNEAMHLLTANQNYSLFIDITDSENNTWVANYDYFAISSIDNRYSLAVDGYHGNSTDGFGYSNNMAFSAPDLDNDASSTHCAYYYEVGWWYKHCQICNLNGRYNIGFVWFNLDNNVYLQLTHSVMKIKPN